MALEVLKHLSSSEFIALQKKVASKFPQAEASYAVVKVQMEGAGKRVTIRFTDGGQIDIIV